MFIDGLGIAGYRSFGDKVQRIGPFSNLNLFVGQNNSGKSNILRFFVERYSSVVETARGGNIPLRITDLDRNLGAKSGKIVVEFGVLIDGQLARSIRERVGGKVPENRKQLLDQILRCNALSHESEVAWFSYEAAWDSRPTLSRNLITSIIDEGVLSESQWQSLWSQMHGRSGGSLRGNWVSEILETLSPIREKVPDAVLIPAIRRVGDPGTQPSGDYSGLGIIDQLARLQHPDVQNQDLKKQFDNINEFLRIITGNSDASLEIPYERDTIQVQMDGKTLPLPSLGTGIHEVIILATAATVLSDQILCIEEPELHMHPSLQRKLLNYLQERTNNQYFISTHSAHILDTPGAAVFHVRLENGNSVVTPVYTDGARSSITADLGYRASDLIQANSIIWVEGPSDRIYLNHWIKTLDPALIEGLHYSIMFYGGRLLSHLTVKDPEVKEFISLRRLNRWVVLVMDSDRSKKGLPVTPTKLRIRSEFEEGPGFAWETMGREIESYVDHATLEDAVKQVHPSVSALKPYGRYDKPLLARAKGGKLVEVDKVKVAHIVTQAQPDWDRLDLRKRVDQVIDFIRGANGM